MKTITELYYNFEENEYCKIFPNEEFMYKEYAVYQPLQRRGVLDAESIERLRTSNYFTSNSSIFNEIDFEQLQEMNPRSAADEKKYQKYLAGRSLWRTYWKFWKPIALTVCLWITASLKSI